MPRVSKKFVVSIDSPDKLKAFENLLTIIGFEQVGPFEYSEPIDKVSLKPGRTPTARKTVKTAKPSAKKATIKKPATAKKSTKKK